MNLFDNKLISSLNTIDIKKLSLKEIKLFNKKKILITGVSGIIGINLLFFFNKLNNEKKNVYLHRRNIQYISFYFC